MPSPLSRARLPWEVLRFAWVCADEHRVNLTFAALNILVVLVVVAIFVVPRLREYRESKLDVSRPNRPGQELADVVTEWAKSAGVLQADGAADPNHIPVEEPNLTDERS